MSLTYIEKGIGLHEAIYAAGFPNFGSYHGVWYADTENRANTSNDATVQAIIDAYDPLPDYKASAVQQIKDTALAKMQTLFPALGDIEMVMLMAELWKSLVAASKSPTANWTTIINTYTAAAGGISAVNAAIDKPGVDAAVAAIAWPI